MPDNYEVAAGLNPNLNDADDDDDLDGVSNYDEFRLGTDPTDAASTPPFTDNFQASFEDGLIPAGWTVPAYAAGGFTPTTVTASDGSWSIESDQVNQSATSRLPSNSAW